jgi:hypothetical protein
MREVWDSGFYWIWSKSIKDELVFLVLFAAVGFV